MKSVLVSGLIVLGVTGLLEARVEVKRKGGGEDQSAAERPAPAPVRVNARPSQGRGGTDTAQPGTSGSVDARPDRPAAPVRTEPVWSRPSTDLTAPRTTAGAISGDRTRIVRRAETPAPERHGAIARNTEVIRSIEQSQRTRVVPNQNTWHRVNGVRYCHSYRGGHHWYGFYHGPHFYWTRYHRGRFWWYDPGFGHWVYWWDDHWRWPGPSGVTYVFIDNNYVRQDEAPDDLDTPPTGGPEAPTDGEAGGEWKSPDDRRLIQIHGPQSEAFLYDNTGKVPVFLAYLGKDAERVRFSGGKDGKALRILVDFKNGDFSLFSEDGEPVDIDLPPTPDSEPTP